MEPRRPIAAASRPQDDAVAGLAYQRELLCPQRLIDRSVCLGLSVGITKGRVAGRRYGEPRQCCQWLQSTTPDRSCTTCTGMETASRSTAR